MSRKREYETPEYGRMMIRMIKAYGRRVSDADPEDLKVMADFARDAEIAVGETVARLRGQGCSWAYLAQGMGISRSAMQHRYEKYGVIRTEDAA
jgi:hypothetical protein